VVVVAGELLPVEQVVLEVEQRSLLFQEQHTQLLLGLAEL
jgi:hypothetical protein